MTHLWKKGIFSRDIRTVAFLIRNEIRHPVNISACFANKSGLFDSWAKVNRYCNFSANMGDKIPTKEELKNKLTPLQYHVTQEKGTERPFTGAYDKKYDEGMYVCLICRSPLFSSKTKFDSGCGWPAFNDVLERGLVKLSKDTSMVGANLLLLLTRPGMVRTEVQCSRCDSHLGHVFDDGPLPTKKRFCINSASIDFIPAGEEIK